MTTPSTTRPTDAQLKKVVGRVLDPYTRDAFKAILPWIEYVMGIPVDLPSPVVFGSGGADGSLQWFAGDGPPTTIVGSRPGDFYFDRRNGDIYFLN